MWIRPRAAAPAAALVLALGSAGLAAPDSARAAGDPLLRATLAGPPGELGGRVTLPVVLDRTSARRLGLRRSRSTVLVLDRRARVLRNGRRLSGPRLRLGDRLLTRGRRASRGRRVKAGRVRVTRRGPVISLGALDGLIDTAERTVAAAHEEAGRALAVPGVGPADPRAVDPSARVELQELRISLNLRREQLEGLAGRLGSEATAGRTGLLPSLASSGSGATSVIERLETAAGAVDSAVPALREAVTYLDEVLIGLSDVPTTPFGDFDIPIGVSDLSRLLQDVLDLLRTLPPILPKSA